MGIFTAVGASAVQLLSVESAGFTAFQAVKR